jgi:hypothetical protein
MLKVQTPNGEDKVLLHSCCAPCSSAIIECMLDIDEMVAPMVAPGSPIDSFCLN